MTAKQYLNRVRRVDTEIEVLLGLVKKTRESLETTTQNYNSDGAQSTKNPHRFDRLIELEGLVDEKVDEQVALKTEILSTIMLVKERRKRIVLMKYYVEMMTFQEIADYMHYSLRQIMNIHGYALKSVQEVLNEKNIS